MAATMTLKQADKIAGFLQHLEGAEFIDWNFNEDDITVITARDVEGDQFEIKFIPNQKQGGKKHV
ncbi:MAG: hypothetical protein RR595_05640 [Lysinibacillus sp.]